MKLKDFLKDNKTPFYLEGGSVRACWNGYLFTGADKDADYLRLYEDQDVLSTTKIAKDKLIVEIGDYAEHSYQEKKKRAVKTYKQFASWASDADVRTAVKHNISVEQLREMLIEEGEL